MTDTVPAIATRGLTKSFGTLEVLKGINLTLMPGEVLGLIGPSGFCSGAARSPDGFAEPAARSAWASCAAMSAWCSSISTCFRI